MKKKIISIALVAIITFGYLGLSKILSSGNHAEYGFSKNPMTFSDDEGDITDAVLSAGKYTLDENDRFVLEMTDTTDIQISSKTSNKVWKAIPDNSFGNNKYSSSLIVTYFADETTKKTLYSSQDSVGKNQFRIFQTQNGTRVEYVFGEMNSMYVYPDIISKERLENYLSKMNDDDREYILRRYQLYVLKEYEKNEQKNLLSEYPRLKNEDIYVLKEITALHIKKKVDEIFRNAGYTEEDKAKDNGDFEAKAKKPETFKISVIYQLTKTGFQTKLDLENCAFYDEYPIDTIQILPYFDAFAKGEEGYLMIPSGSGALTYINSSKMEDSKINVPVYGKNLALNPQNDIADNQCSFPMFGVYKDHAAYMCSFQSCGEQTDISAETSERYSSIFPSFSIIDSQVASLHSESIIWLHANECSTHKIESEYYLIEGVEEDNAYSRMAELYREKLISDGVLGEKINDKNIPLAAEIVNTVNYDTMAFGCFPVNKEVSLTSFAQTGQIAEQLSEFVDAKNLKIILSGWNLKGLGAQSFDKITFSKIAGGEKGLKKLQNYLTKNKIESFLNVNFNDMIPHSGDRFQSNTQSVRDINNSVVNVERYDPKNNSFKKTTVQLISPTQFSKVWNGFSKEGLFKKSGMSVNQLTLLLYGDYANGKVKSRNYSIGQVCEVLEKAKADNISLIGEGANIYAIPYLDLLNHIPVSSNDEQFFDQDIPFVQMVLHGYVEYTSSAINDLSNSDNTLLKLIEAAGGLNYRLTMNHFEEIFETDYSYLYNTDFSTHKASVKAYYEKVSKALEGLYDQKMISHCFLSDDVVKVSYENGTIILLNYGKKDFSYDGQVCKAKDYLRMDN